MERTLRDWRAITVFVGPALAVYTLILLGPILWSVGYTFFSGGIISGFEPAGLSNYSKLVHDDAFWRATGVTVKYAVAVTIGQVLIGLFLSLLYMFYLRRASGLIRTLVFFPVVLPTVAVAQLFVKLFQIAPQPGLVGPGLAGYLRAPPRSHWRRSQPSATVVVGDNARVGLGAVSLRGAGPRTCNPSMQVSSGRVESANSVLVSWPASDLASRERRGVRVRVWGMDGSASDWSEPAEVEAGLLHAADWRAQAVVHRSPGTPNHRGRRSCCARGSRSDPNPCGPGCTQPPMGSTT